MFNPYTKAIIGALLAFLGTLATGWDDSVLTTSEIVLAIGAGISALGLIWAANKNIKWVVSGILAGVASLAVALEDDAVSAQEWITIAVVTLTALAAVYEQKNTAPSNAPEQL